MRRLTLHLHLAGSHTHQEEEREGVRKEEGRESWIRKWHRYTHTVTRYPHLHGQHSESSKGTTGMLAVYSQPWPDGPVSLYTTTNYYNSRHSTPGILNFLRYWLKWSVLSAYTASDVLWDGPQPWKKCVNFFIFLWDIMECFHEIFECYSVKVVWILYFPVGYYGVFPWNFWVLFR